MSAVMKQGANERAAPHCTGSVAGMLAYAAKWPAQDFEDAQGWHWQYRDSLGTLPPLLLLPGALGNGDVAFRLAEALQPYRRVISITYPSGAAAIALAMGLNELMTRLVLPQAAIWGSSYGAWWAQAFARIYPHRVSHLWLGNTLVDGTDVETLPLFSLKWLQRVDGQELVTAWHDALAIRPRDDLGQLQAWMLDHGLPAEALRRRLLQVARASALPPVGTLHNLVVSDCEDDSLIGPATRERVRARYAGAWHVTLSSGGHYPHVTRPEELLVPVRRWLQL